MEKHDREDRAETVDQSFGSYMSPAIMVDQGKVTWARMEMIALNLNSSLANLRTENWTHRFSYEHEKLDLGCGPWALDLDR
jgi:hypothetical protein